MHGHDSRGVRRDGRLDLFGIDVSGFFVYVDEHGLQSVPPNGMGRRDKTVRGGNHFARNAQCLQGRNQGERSVGEKADVLDTKVIGKSFFEFLVVMAIVCQPFSIPNILKHRDEIFQFWKKGGRDCNRFIFAHNNLRLVFLFIQKFQQFLDCCPVKYTIACDVVNGSCGNSEC